MEYNNNGEGMNSNNEEEIYFEGQNFEGQEEDNEINEQEKGQEEINELEDEVYNENNENIEPIIEEDENKNALEKDKLEKK